MRYTAAGSRSLNAMSMFQGVVGLWSLLPFICFSEMEHRVRGAAGRARWHMHRFLGQL